VIDDDLINVRANITLTLINERTGESITTTTNSLGQYIFDCANFESGYTDLDFLLIQTDSTGTNGKDLRLKFISRGLGQIDEIKCEYATRS
jgi:hypothetical protein